MDISLSTQKSSAVLRGSLDLLFILVKASHRLGFMGQI